ncbi:expressed unknown protein [Seminavis robusta]|uniref:Uncharacterized protein n=1 Tax=Seminavis robusta TaxID=568900 RepID=A0A9N8EMF4_9STRA|nr:expressed unknown protein [Seminavis robusta]|eukprot:Sro1258_g256780.1 n/a (119) ;mRNA; r:5452-5808
MCRENKIAVAVSPTTSSLRPNRPRTSSSSDSTTSSSSSSHTSSSTSTSTGTGTRRKSRRSRQSSSVMEDFQVKVHARRHLEERSREMGFLCPQMYLVVKPTKGSSRTSAGRRKATQQF